MELTSLAGEELPPYSPQVLQPKEESRPRCSRPATQGSAGIDLPLAGNYNLEMLGVVQICDTMLQGPLPEGTVGLVLPRSSASQRGIQIIPGVIDSDYQGIVKIQILSNSMQQVLEGEKLSHNYIVTYGAEICYHNLTPN
uniref:dUTPase-like domain-containing protein n=1 Tax=Naja naja TaxID=35670 RepID=A0A8C6Y036_NAJNA